MGSKALVTFWAVCRWLKPLIKVLNAASKALPEEAEPAGRDQNSAAAANTRQDADVTKQAPKEQAVLLCAEHPFIKAVASAAAMAKVNCVLPLEFDRLLHHTLICS